MLLGFLLGFVPTKVTFSTNNLEDINHHKVCGHENTYLPYEESKLTNKTVYNISQIFIFSYYSLVETLLLPLSPSFGHAVPDNQRPHHH